MNRILLTYIFLFLCFVVIPVKAQETYKVLKVIDGDTIQVDIHGKKEVVRLLGIDSPESVDPRKTVQCFAKEATIKLKSYVDGKQIILVEDSTQGNRDRYNRLLRYVYLPNSVQTFVNGEMVKQGFAFSYKQYPTKLLSKFNSFEAYAREHSLGLWNSCPLSPTPTKTVLKKYVAPKYTAPTAKYTRPTPTYIVATTSPNTDSFHMLW